MRRLSLLALVAAAACAAGADLSIDGPKTVTPYKLVELTPANAPADAAVLWDVSPEDVADVREIGGRLIFTAPPGTYRVKLRTIQGKAVVTARATVVIGDAPPIPPIPPGPDPVPVPPAPPVDPLAAEIRVLFDKDPAPVNEKRATARLLAAVYAHAVPMVGDSAMIPTAGKLRQVLADASTNLARDKLTTVRERKRDELKRILPSDPDAVLDAATRVKAAELFARLATILEGLAK